MKLLEININYSGIFMYIVCRFYINLKINYKKFQI